MWRCVRGRGGKQTCVPLPLPLLPTSAPLPHPRPPLSLPPKHKHKHTSTCLFNTAKPSPFPPPPHPHPPRVRGAADNSRPIQKLVDRKPSRPPLSFPPRARERNEAGAPTLVDERPPSPQQHHSAMISPSLYWGQEEDERVRNGGAGGEGGEGEEELLSPTGITYSRAPPSCLRNSASTQNGGAGGGVGPVSGLVSLARAVSRAAPATRRDATRARAPPRPPVVLRHPRSLKHHHQHTNNTAHHPLGRAALGPAQWVLLRRPSSPPRRLYADSRWRRQPFIPAAVCGAALLTDARGRSGRGQRLWHDSLGVRRLWARAPHLPAPAAQGSAAAGLL